MKKISKAGIYDLTNEEYHGDCCEGVSISSTGLRQTLECPAKYWATSVYNPNRIEPEQKACWELGKAVHELILEGKDPADKYHVTPKGFNPRNKVLNGSEEEMEEAEEQLAKAIEAGKTIVKATEFDLQKMQDMTKALKSHAYAWGFFKNGEPEKSLIWQDKHTGLWLKSRPDWFPNGGKIMPDLKTARDASPEAFSRSIAQHGYHIQLALLWEGLRAMRAEGVTEFKPEILALVVQETSHPYVVTPYNIDMNTIIHYGRLELRKAINLFAECLKTGKWAGYDWRNTKEAMVVGLPYWRETQYESAIERGDYDKEKETVYEHDPENERSREPDRRGHPLDAG